MFNYRLLNRLAYYKNQVRHTRKLINRDKKGYIEEGVKKDSSIRGARRLAKNLMVIKYNPTTEKIIIGEEIIVHPKSLSEKINYYFTDKIMKIKQETEENVDEAVF